MHLSYLCVHRLFQTADVFFRVFQVVLQNALAALALVVLFLDLLIFLRKKSLEVINLLINIANVFNLLIMVFIGFKVSPIKPRISISQLLIALAFECRVPKVLFFDFSIEPALLIAVHLALLKVFLDLRINLLILVSNDFIEFLNFIIETGSLVFVVNFKRRELAIVDIGSVIALRAQVLVVLHVELPDLVLELSDFVPQRNVFFLVVIFLSSVLFHESLDFVILKLKKLL